jgi:putative DNA primase/helicase
VTEHETIAASKKAEADGRSGEQNGPINTDGFVIVPPPSDPMAVARAFIAAKYVGVGGTILLRHHRNSFYCYAGDHWPEDDERRVKSELWKWLEAAVYQKGKSFASFEPNQQKVSNVIEGLRAIGHIAEGVQPPVWLQGDATSQIIAGEVVPLANGILEFSTRKLRPHTPELFEQHVLPFEYDPDATCPRWHRFLTELWEDDEESKATLQEIFGYILSNQTKQQKIFMPVGPKRSGKGTIIRVLIGLLGAHNTAAPTLASLTQNFGLQCLIGRPLAAISDARLGTRADNLIAVERLLSISGEDSITIDRKYRDPWTGRLPTRFMILTNELPRFSDSSGALASRFVILVLTKSFYGKENPNLTNELLEESACIFNWALEGLDRLHERGYFVTPASALEAQRHLEDLASPISAFVRDRCEVGPLFEVATVDLWKAWKEWLETEGGKPGTKSVFIRDLRAAVPGLTPQRARVADARVYGYRGLGLKLGPQSGGPRTTPDQEEEDGVGLGSENRQISLNHLGGPGWSGVGSIVDPTSANGPGCLVCGQPCAADRLRCDDCLKTTEDEAVIASRKQSS